MLLANSCNFARISGSSRLCPPETGGDGDGEGGGTWAGWATGDGEVGAGAQVGDFGVLGSGSGGFRIL